MASAAAPTIPSVLSDIVFASLVWRDRKIVRRRLRASPPSGFEARPSDERAGDDRETVRDLQRQRRQAARRRAVQDSGARLEVELREVARAFDGARRGLPVPLVTSGVRADGGVRDDAVHRPRAGVPIERPRIEADEQDLVQATVVADDPGGRVLRLGGERPPAGGEVGEGDEPALALPGGEHEANGRLRTGPARADAVRPDAARQRPADAP